MPRALQWYIAGLVVASAGALVAASFVFSVMPGFVLAMRPEISIIPGSTRSGTSVRRFDLLDPGNAVRLCHAGPDAAGHDRFGVNRAHRRCDGVGGTGCRRLGRSTRDDRTAGGARARPLVRHVANHAGLVLPAIIGGVVASGHALKATAPTFGHVRRHDGAGAALFHGLNVIIDGRCRLAPRWARIPASRAWGIPGPIWPNLFALAPWRG